jgi:hypothetical protein
MVHFRDLKGLYMNVTTILPIVLSTITFVGFLTSAAAMLLMWYVKRVWLRHVALLIASLACWWSLNFFLPFATEQPESVLHFYIPTVGTLVILYWSFWLNRNERTLNLELNR